MIDGYLGMLGMIWGFAIYLYINEFPSKSLHVYILAALLVYSIARTWEKKYILERRLEGYVEIFEMYPDSPKLFGLLKLHDWNQFWYPYEIPVETLMLTSLEGPENSKTLFIDYDNRGVGDLLEGKGYFINFYNKSDIDVLNKKFFRLSDKHSYKHIERVPWKWEY